MHPIFGKYTSAARFTLCNLIFMMWKYQVFAASMNIYLLSQVFFRHYRALNMPARTPFAPWRYPIRFSIFFRLPKYKIQCVFLLILSRYQKGTISSLQIIQIFMGQLTILCKTAGAIVYRTIYCIRIALLYQVGNHRNHTINLLRR